MISTKLLAGRTIVHVDAEARPGEEFEPVEPDLKDVYFSVMAGHHGRRAVAAGVAAGAATGAGAGREVEPAP